VISIRTPEAVAGWLALGLLAGLALPAPAPAGLTCTALPWLLGGALLLRPHATALMRALFALLYESAIEVSTALALTRSDVWGASKEIRWTVSDWHRETVGWEEETREGLNLPNRYPLHCARDHRAVRAARAGNPVAVIQAQLGHGSPMLTLTKYGRFLPSTADRAKWQTAATEYETRRRRSTSNAG
jgi:integrase